MRSIINDRLEVTKESAVVSILRKPEGSNPEHAFILVEGQNSFGKAYFRRYDLFINEDNPDKSLVKIKESQPMKDIDRKRYLEELLNYEGVDAKAWPITAREAKLLHQDILKDKENPPNYQVSGDKSLIAKSSCKEGHSCFSWAREKLLKLYNPNIRIETKIQDFIIAQTSKYIYNDQNMKASRKGVCHIL